MNDPRYTPAHPKSAVDLAPYVGEVVALRVARLDVGTRTTWVGVLDRAIDHGDLDAQPTTTVLHIGGERIDLYHNDPGDRHDATIVLVEAGRAQREAAEAELAGLETGFAASLVRDPRSVPASDGTTDAPTAEQVRQVLDGGSSGALAMLPALPGGPYRWLVLQSQEHRERVGHVARWDRKRMREMREEYESDERVAEKLAAVFVAPGS